MAQIRTCESGAIRRGKSSDITNNLTVRSCSTGPIPKHLKKSRRASFIEVLRPIIPTSKDVNKTTCVDEFTPIRTSRRCKIQKNNNVTGIMDLSFAFVEVRTKL